MIACGLVLILDKIPSVPVALTSRRIPGQWLARAGFALKPGTKELIDTPAQSGIPTAVATSMQRADVLHQTEMHNVKEEQAPSISVEMAG